MRIQALTLLSITLLVGCQNPVTKAVNKVEYSAYELVGIQKRDLLKTRVDDTREEQKQAGKDFQDALAKLKAVYGFNGGKLENKYDELKSSYEKSSHQAEVVHKSIRKVQTVAKDLFDEWDKEIGEISTESLKDKSRESLEQTKERFSKLDQNLKKSESRMDSVLQILKDHVLFLKHNLNAKAIGSLKGESTKIQSNVEDLVQEMNKSIQAADQFIKEMPSNN
jgi:ElaB/YqjD/DUF883 family membrane-anchored ribosome-binding protein